jgi:hypothetical protein
MLYDIKQSSGNDEKAVDFLSELKVRMKKIKYRYDTIEATDRKILIKDQQDFYCAVVHQALYSPQSLTIPIQLSCTKEEYEEFDDGSSDNDDY